MTAPVEPDTTHTGVDVDELLHKHDLISLFRKASFSENFHRIVAGLKAPKESGEHKYAKLQVQRLSAPTSAIVVPMIAVGLLALFARNSAQPKTELEIRILRPEPIQKLEDKPKPDPDPVKPLMPITVDFTPPVLITDDHPAPTPNVNLNPQLPLLHAVVRTKGPVFMKGITSRRAGPARGRAHGEYGAPDGVEDAVLRTLRWLKKHQNEQGFWSATSGMNAGANSKSGEHATAMTSFAILTYLAYAETPASEEFGATVSKAIRWLVAQQKADGRMGGSYEHQIAAYALCEAYAMTKTPMVKDAAESAVNIIISGQNPYGGWDYKLSAADERNDSSVMAWCVQALKAAKISKLDCPGLDECMAETVDGFKKNWDARKGGFGYATTGPEQGTGATGLNGAGILSMLFLGAAKDAETRAAIRLLDETRSTFDWEMATWKQVYYWYYDTQARFHTGGKIWDSWNNEFAAKLIEAQTIQRGAGVDGKDIGFWETGEDREGLVMSTILCNLTLQVYVRYLPTYRPPEQSDDDDIAMLQDDVGIDISLPQLQSVQSTNPPSVKFGRSN